MRHKFHALCPYFAMFPETFAERWIDRLSKPDDLILDPFCGRGTTPFQALTMGRRAVGTDINPVAYCVTRAKTNAPTAKVLRARVTRLENLFVEAEWTAATDELPDFFRHAFSSSTLNQLFYLRHALKWELSDVDCMIAAMILGILHGESHRSSRYLSNRMPRTISTKPRYSMRYWRQNGCTAPKRDVFEAVRREITFRYRSTVPEGRAEVALCDFRSLPTTLSHRSRKVHLVVTSPPYLNVTNFEEDQWLRLWFLGSEPRPTYYKISKDDRHESQDRYWQFIGDMWRVLGRLVADSGWVVVRIGGKALAPDALIAGLEATNRFSGRNVRLESVEVTDIKGRQTRAFRPGSKGCAKEVDCCFQFRDLS